MPIDRDQLAGRRVALCIDRAHDRLVAEAQHWNCQQQNDQRQQPALDEESPAAPGLGVRRLIGCCTCIRNNTHILICFLV